MCPEIPSHPCLILALYAPNVISLSFFLSNQFNAVALNRLVCACLPVQLTAPCQTLLAPRESMPLENSCVYLIGDFHPD